MPDSQGTGRDPSARRGPVVAVLVLVLTLGIILGVAPQSLVPLAIDLVGALLILLPPAAAGLWLVRRRDLSPPTGGSPASCNRGFPETAPFDRPLRPVVAIDPWWFVVGMALGLGGCAILVLLLGWMGWLQRPVWLILLGALAVAGTLRMVSILSTDGNDDSTAKSSKSGSRTTGRTSRGVVRTSEEQSPGIQAVTISTVGPPPCQAHSRSTWLWLVAAPFLGLALIAAENAPGFIWREEGYGYDVLEYHLELPKEYRAAGRIGYTPHNVYGSFPANVEMLYLLAMVVLDGDVDLGTTCNLIHLLLGLLTVGSAWAICRRWSLRAAHCAAVALATTGWMTYLGVLAYVEHGVLLFGLLSWSAVLRAKLFEGSATDGMSSGHPASGVERSRMLWCSGLLAGLACGCKYTAVPMIALPAVIGSFLLPSGRTDPRRGRWTDAGRILAGSVLSMSPWLIKNLLHTGNPVFPLAGSVLDTKLDDWGPEERERWRAGHASSIDRPLVDRLEALWQRIPGDPLQRFGPAILVIGLVGLWGRRRDESDRFLLAAMVIQVVVWTGATHLYARFSVVMLIPLTLLVARAASRNRGGRPAVLEAAIVCGALWNLYHIGGLTRSEAIPPGSADLFHEGWLPGFEYLGAINRESPSEARVLLVGEARPFYVRREVQYQVVFNRNRFAELLETHDDASVLDWLEKEGLTHVLVHWHEIRRLRATYGFSGAVTPERFSFLEQAGLRRIREFHLPGEADPYGVLYAVPVGHGDF